MSEFDDHVIPYEEAVRRHRAREARKQGSAVGELKISDAMSHLLEEATAQDDGGPTPAHLRDIVAREFADTGDEEASACTLDRRQAMRRGAEPDPGDQVDANGPEADPRDR
jgi:hypothetical protein